MRLHFHLTIIASVLAVVHPVNLVQFFILGVYTVRISNIELDTVPAFNNRTGSI
jgi:hypothetical protein